MKYSIGTDIVYLKRFSVSKIEELAKRVLHQSEINLYNKISNPDRKIEFVAGRIALKEACFKAFVNKDFKFNNLAITLIDNKLTLSLYNKILDNISLSLSHDGEYVVAFVIVEY